MLLKTKIAFLFTIFVILMSSLLLTELYTGVNVLSNFHLQNYLPNFMVSEISEENQIDSIQHFSSLIQLRNQAENSIFDENYSNAFKIYDEILMISPLEVNAWYGKIFVLEKMGKYDDASNLKIRMNETFLSSNP